MLQDWQFHFQHVQQENTVMRMAHSMTVLSVIIVRLDLIHKSNVCLELIRMLLDKALVKIVMKVSIVILMILMQQMSIESLLK